MKKVKKTPDLDKDLDGVTLYLDDVRDILDAMKAISPNGKLEIQVGDYELSSLDEVTQIREKEVKRLDVGYSAYPVDYKTPADDSDPLARQSLVLIEKLRVSIDRFVYIHNRGDYTPAVAGAAAEIRRILKSRQRWWRRRQAISGAILGAWITVAVIAMTVGQIGKSYFGFGDRGDTIIGIGGGMLFLGAIGPAALLTLASQSKIILTDRVEASSFWSRNRDALILNLITSVVGLLLGILGTLAVQALIKQTP